MHPSGSHQPPAGQSGKVHKLVNKIQQEASLILDSIFLT